MNNLANNVRFNFLFIDKYICGRNWVFPEINVPYNLFRYIVSGTGVFFIDDKEIDLEQDQIVYIPKGSRLSCYSQSDDFCFISIRFTTSVHFADGDILTDYYGLPFVVEGSSEKTYFETMYEWVKKESPARMFFLRGYLEVLIGSIVAKAETEHQLEIWRDAAIANNSLEKMQERMVANKNGVDPRIQKVVDEIFINPTKKFTPENMSELAELSKQRFSALFKEQMGSSPMAFVRERRLATAASKLVLGNENISDIAYEVGYEDPNYFIREFKARYGNTPKQYRKKAME